MPDESPWNEAAAWYCATISYVEAHGSHPEAIAFWCMMGNYELGAAEPCLWDREDNPAITASTEAFVKRVWPAFRAAGKRSKAGPILLPIFSKTPYWMAKPPAARLSAFANLKRWLIDDLGLPPDYWPISAYPLCDPAPDGFHYLRAIVEILGAENARRILLTDLKGPGHEDVRDCMLAIEGPPGTELLECHFRKRAEYGFGGWWIWAYQDTPRTASGIRTVDGAWKDDLVDIVRRQAQAGR